MRAFLPFLTKCVFLLCYVHPAMAYEIRTHEAITEKVVDTIIATIDIPTNLNIQSKQLFPNPAVMPNCKPKTDECSHLGDSMLGTFKDMILNGSSYEDLETLARPLNHFYNPVDDYGIKLKNPDWALETNFSSYNEPPEQEFSYPDAYSYFYTALTTTDEQERNKNFGKMFQSLGQVLHLLEDMAAIEHVRNDPHIVFIPSEKSRFELYTEESVIDKKPSFLQLLFSTNVINFSKERDYWVTNPKDVAKGKGLSEFTNMNFFSQDRINLEFDQNGQLFSSGFPKPVDGIKYEPVKTLFAGIGKELPEKLQELCPTDPLAANQIEDCVIGFVKTEVIDNITGQQQLFNNRAASFSLFDVDLEYVCGTSPFVCSVNRQFALNRFNFDEMHKFLIPRAVAYSAGLLKHFFRGKLEISRPDTGFYFDVDSIVNQSYTKVSLQAQNTTEQVGSWAQDMSGGNIEVVVRYTLPNNTEEKVSNSSKQTTTLLVGDAPSKLTFDLSTPVPVDAENVNLYLVYRGTLGEETDVVVVGRQSVEPLTIETVAGTGVGGFSGDGGFAKNAQLYFPHSIALDNEGNLYISEYGNDRIRKVFTNGTIITIAGSGQRGYSTGGGSALQASLDGPTGIAIGPEGAVYFIDSYNNTLRKVLNSTITNVAGNFYSGGYVKTATGNPVGVRDGRLIFNGSTLYMTQSTMSTIYKIDGNLASIIAGNVAYNPWNPAPYPNNGASALQTTLGIPYGITWHNGALHFSDLLYKQVFKLDTCTNGASCLYTVAGNGNSDFAEDNVAATQASLNYPSGVASSPSGNLYITAENEHRVRSVGADGKITTIAGNGIAGSSGDGGLPIKASLNTPSGLVVAPNGDLYITELNGHRVRRIKGLK